MSTSNRVCSNQLRAIYSLVWECRELGADAFIWRQHLLEGLGRLLGDHVGIGGEGRWSLPDRTFLPPIITVDCGWESDSARQIWVDSMKRLGPNGACMMKAFLSRFKRPHHAAFRRQILDDTAYLTSDYFECKKRCRLDDEMYSLHELSAGHYDILTTHRRIGGKRWTVRDVKLLKLVHAEIALIIGRELASLANHDPVPLSHRLKQTLDALLEGLEEKQVAARLRLSPHTVHQYIKTLYRRYRVESRAELLSLWIRRHEMGHATRDVGAQ